MKKIVALLAFLGLATPAFAQQQVILGQGIPQQELNALTALSTILWMPSVPVSDFATASSKRTVAPLPGFLREAWVSIDTGGTGATSPVLHVGFAISKRNGAQATLGEVDLTSPLGTGTTASLNFGAGAVRLEEGDTIVVGWPTNTGFATTVGTVVLRVGAF